MLGPEQQLIDDLRAAPNLPEGSGAVDFVSTHCSLVFLARENVYKVKRAKNYGFLDYSTLEKRAHFCREEVRLNRRTAPSVYLGVLPVYRDSGGFSLVRDGEIADWAVHMRRLPDDRSALALLREDALAHEDLVRTARVLAAFYRDHSIDRAPFELGHNIDENFEQVCPFVGRLLDQDLFDETQTLQRRWLADKRGALMARGTVDGHGDLRLEHVYLLPEGPTIIDCIEFTERFRVGDPALDVAFLVMDLRHNGRPELAESFLGWFARESDDHDLYSLIDGYVSYRAWVRGKVACFVADDPATGGTVRARKQSEALRFFELARESLAGDRPKPQLIAVGGMIASGKSTLAEALARAVGAPVLCADAIRKSLAGIEHDAPGDAALYTADFTRRVQDELLRRAAVVLASGRSVLLDTTFRSRSLRERARALAYERSSRFLFIECRVPERVARERLRARTSGVSDAREDLYGSFAASWEPVTELTDDEHATIDGTRPSDELVAGLRALLSPRACPRMP